MSERSSGTMVGPKRSTAYEVGYGKPPADHRFPKGRSGNPRGRPHKGSAPFGRRDLLDVLTQAARESIAVTKNGRTTRTTRIEALAQQLLLKALQGDMKAAKLLFDNIKALAPATEADGHSQQEGRTALDDRLRYHPGIEVRFVSPGDVVSKPIGT
ncbi:DUF5681 domain-containing protein [Methylobacterium sp. Leaf108]|uniref:DUF5681 domain-containing protein n=1 Tax=Methylobacterium sp. Leaf108 TaxID=1736256 RepID=UPI0006FA99D7|nr:DUF5681 domain-containing protein [Methylobacterium sp. Leaf108]KQP56317.1 hypothetical protein ASF39_19030 [Methylobacterium sp. Leaf108]